MGQWSEQGSPGQGGRSRGRTEPSDSSPRSDSSLEVVKMGWIKRNKRSQQNFSHMSCHEFLNLDISCATCIRLRHSWQISSSRYYLPWNESSFTKPGKNFSKVRSESAFSLKVENKNCEYCLYLLSHWKTCFYSFVGSLLLICIQIVYKRIWHCITM